MALHGRDAELALLDEVLASGRAGRGRALCLTGEAGIGKSTLLSEARIKSRDALVLSGAAWESGGAPPYWPWLQVLRAAADAVGDTVKRLPGADRIASLVDGWGPPRVDAAAPDPAAARFALLDAVVRALVALSTEQPLVIILDDLHAADMPTLDLLVLLVRELPATRITLLAAWREGELAVRTDAAQRLARASRSAIVHPLRRLTADEVASWVGRDAASIYASSEGNPLFVEELLRVQRGGVAHGLQAALADHLALVSDDTRDLLAIASVVGREIDPRLLATIAQRSEHDIARALREAQQVGVVSGTAFRHVLLRDHLYDSLEPSRRAGLHRAAGEALANVDRTRAAHHFLQSDDVQHAIASVRTAAAHAMTVFAFEDAADLLGQALARADSIDVRLELAAALHSAGRHAKAREICVRAHEMARAAGDAERMASAAMIYASELFSGRRDPTMIALLQQARAALPTTDSPTLARLMARLAAALVPSLDAPEVPEALAMDAVAMARRIGDDATIMFALRFALHAHGFRLPLPQAIAMAEEVVALSDRVGRPLEALEQRTMLIGGNLALGRRAAADAAFESLSAVLQRLPQPQYRWRLSVCRALAAFLRGDLTDADRHLATARTIAIEHELDRARGVVVFAQLGMLAGTLSRNRASGVLDELRTMLPAFGVIGGVIQGFVEAVAGEHQLARTRLRPELFHREIILLQFGVEAILLLRETALVPLAIDIMEFAASRHPMVNGPSGSMLLRPVATVLGELYLLQGRVADAIAQIESGLALARSIYSIPHIANAANALARALDARGEPGDRERAVSLSAEAHELWHRCSRDEPAVVSQQALALVGDDIEWRGRRVALPAGKGSDYLRALFAAPAREIHVSDLVGDDDRGDAGEVLDAKARAAYTRRASELTGELEEARARNDLGRTERLSEELDAITEELLGATGLGGRARKAGSRIDRARVNVQRRIKDAIKKLAAQDPALGRYLEATIRTGTFCSFVPVDS